jgi:uncharacterized membrane protein YdjX (TVP38/TMEM64 family)
MNRRLLLALVLVSLAALVLLMFGDRLDLDYLQSRHTALVARCAEHPLIAALIYFGVFVLFSALSLPAAGLLMVASGALFGLWTGLPLASVSSCAGAAVSFLLSRYLLRDWVKHRFAPWLASVDYGVEREGAFYVFALRMIPAVPFFVINPLMGLTTLPLRQFVIATFLGLMPATALLVFAGTRLTQLKSIADVLDAPLIAALATLGVFPLLARRLIPFLRRHRG